MKISPVISKLILVALLLMPQFVLAQNQTISVNGSQIQISSTLQAVFDQAETIYMSPSGHSLEVLYNDVPNYLPVLVGLIMQRQRLYMEQIRNPKHIDNANAVEKELTFFFSQLAQAYNNKNPTDGSNMSARKLEYDYMVTLDGAQNEHYIKSMGIDPTKVEIAYLLDRSPNTNNVVANTDGHAKLQLQDEEDEIEKVNKINLFGVAVIGGADPPQDIAIKRNGGPGKAKGQICPEQAKKSFRIDTNGNPDDETYCWCDYNNGFLRYQMPLIYGKKHGMELFYNVTKAGVRFLNWQAPYINGKTHGEYIKYSEYTYQGGRIGLSSVTPMVNGVTHGIMEAWFMTDSGINYLSKTVPYIKGVRHGKVKTYKYSNSGKYFLFRKESYKNVGGNSKSHGDHIIYGLSGGVQVIDKYNEGEFISSKCFYKSGKQIKKGDPAALETWEEGYSCGVYVSWEKTDWDW